MSGIGKAVSKVFKSVGNIVKKVWKPLVIAAAIYFTGGAALGAMGVIGGGATGLAGAAAGLSSAAGAIGIGGGAAAAGAADLGAGAAADLGGAGVLTAEGAADAGIGGAAAGGGSVLGADSVLGGTAGVGGGGIGASSLLAGTTGAGGESGYGSAITNGANYLGGPTAPGAPSSLWDTSLGVAKSVLGTPGVPSLIGGVAQGLIASNLQNAQMKWQEAHAPGQIAGGAANAWGGFAQNKNLTPTTPMPTSTQLPALQPYHQAANQATAPAMPGINQPGSNSANYPGYGTPGYGQQFPPGTGPYGTQPLAAVQPGMMPQDQYQQQGLLSQQTPFIESPYDESYV